MSPRDIAKVNQLGLSSLTSWVVSNGSLALQAQQAKKSNTPISFVSSVTGLVWSLSPASWALDLYPTSGASRAKALFYVNPDAFWRTPKAKSVLILIEFSADRLRECSVGVDAAKYDMCSCFDLGAHFQQKSFWLSKRLVATQWQRINARAFQK